MSKWIRVNDQLPYEGNYMVSFLIKVLGRETPFIDKRLYAEGYFNPQTGWSIENRYIYHPLYQQPYQSEQMRVTHWMPLPEPPKC